MLEADTKSEHGAREVCRMANRTSAIYIPLWLTSSKPAPPLRPLEEYAHAQGRALVECRSSLACLTVQSVLYFSRLQLSGKVSGSQ